MFAINSSAEYRSYKRCSKYGNSGRWWWRQLQE